MMEPAKADVPGLRFSCPACRMLLEVPVELAGVRGPCPGCGQEIDAPPAPVMRPIEIKPRPHRVERGGDRAAPPRGTSLFTSVPLPISTLGTPPPRPAPVEARPPVPRQPPIPPIVREPPRPETIEEQAAWGIPPRTRRRRAEQSRQGRLVDPGSTLPTRDRERQEAIAIAKIVLAVIVTLALAMVIAKVTKRSVLGAPRDLPPPDVERPDFRR